jgi:hypothetical protein
VPAGGLAFTRARYPSIAALDDVAFRFAPGGFKQESGLSFLIAFILAVFAGVLYYADQGGDLAFVCNYTLDLCQHPAWPLVAACGIAAFGMVFRAHRM